MPPPRAVEISEQISADSFAVFDLNSGSILAQKNADDPHAIASLTKLMTALLIFENHAPTEIVEISEPEVVATPPVKMNLRVGEKIALKNVLRGLLISSANDAAVAVALFHSDSVSDFVVKMNARAQKLGLRETKFRNPHGLDSWGQFSTAREIGILAGFLWRKKNENWGNFFAETVGTEKFVVRSQNGEISHELKNTNQLLGAGNFGMKTGTTILAGQCFVGVFRRDGREILTVVLGSKKKVSKQQE